MPLRRQGAVPSGMDGRCPDQTIRPRGVAGDIAAGIESAGGVQSGLGRNECSLIRSSLLACVLSSIGNRAGCHPSPASKAAAQSEYRSTVAITVTQAIGCIGNSGSNGRGFDGHALQTAGSLLNTSRHLALQPPSQRKRRLTTFIFHPSVHTNRDESISHKNYMHRQGMPGSIPMHGLPSMTSPTSSAS